MNNQQKFTNTNTTTETETVPVYQEETYNTTTPSTTESSGTDLESAADQAIAEMDAGNDVFYCL